MICLTRGIFDIKVEGKVMQWTQTCCTLLKALSALQGNRTCMAIRAVVYSGWICPTAAGSTVQTGARSKNSVMDEKIHLCALTSEHTRHHSKTRRWLLSKYPERHSSTTHTALDTQSTAMDTHCTQTHMTPLPPSPESRVSPQPPVWAPGVRFYALPTFPVPERSAGADPDPTNATPIPGTDAGGRPDLAAGHKSTSALGFNQMRCTSINGNPTQSESHMHVQAEGAWTDRGRR